MLSKSSCCWTLGSLKLWRFWSRSRSRSRSSSSAVSWAGWCQLCSLCWFLSLTSLQVWLVHIVPAALILYCWRVARSFELVKRLSRWTACPFPWFSIHVMSLSITACVFEKPCFSYIIWSPYSPSSFSSPFTCQRRSNTYPWSARTQILNLIRVGFIRI